MKIFYTIFKIGFILITAFLVISIFLVMNNKYNFPLLKEKNKIDTIYTKIINNEINIIYVFIFIFSDECIIVYCIVLLYY